MTKKIDKRLLIMIVFFLLSYLISFGINILQENFGNDFIIENYDVEVIVNEYGDLNIKEKIHNEYSVENRGFYKNIVYSKNNNFSKPQDVSSLVNDVSLLVENSNGVVFDSTVNSNSNDHFVRFSYNDELDESGLPIECEEGVLDCEMVVYFNSLGIDLDTTFTLEYNIIGAVTSYADIAELNWKFLDVQSMRVNNININVKFPDNFLNKDDLLVYGHGVMAGDFEFISNNELVINVPYIKKGEFVEMRILTPTEMFTSIRSQNKTTRLAKIALIAAENEVLDYANKLRTIQTTTYFILGGLMLYFSILFIYIYLKYDREYKSDFYGEYYRELPAEYEPAIMGYLYRFGKIEDNDLAATILDLIRKKYLVLDMNNAQINDKEPNFIIRLNKDSNIEILKDYEKYTIKWFIDEIGDGQSVSLNELKNYTKKEINALKYKEMNAMWVDKLTKQSNTYEFWDEETINFKKRKSIVGVVGIIFTAIFTLIYLYYNIDSTLPIAIVSGIITFGYYMYCNKLNRRSKKANEEYIRWKAFKKFLEDFSTFKDYPLPSIIVWEHYLVYAASFGIADKVMNQLKLRFSAAEMADSNLTFGRHFNDNFFLNWYLFNSISRLRINAITTVNTAQAARVAKSAGGRIGGGGFSGGSSFGGGGGSFGGRR